jgi:hypothetical protein
MVPGETVLGTRGRGIRESSRQLNSTMIYLIYCKNRGKYYNVPPPNRTIKKIRFSDSEFTVSA